MCHKKTHCQLILLPYVNQIVNTKSLKNTLMGNPDTKSKIENFEKLRYEIQLMQYTGEE